MTIEMDDCISRCIIFNKAFRSGIHVDEVLFVFSTRSNDGASHESGVLRRLAPNDTDVHRIGCDIAAAQNARASDPDPGPRRRYYCGFRTAVVANLPVKGEGYAIALALIEEGGEPSHVDIAVTVSAASKNERATAKTEAGLAMAEAFGPAVEHVCDIDASDDFHPIHLDPLCLRRAFPQTGQISFVAGEKST